MKNIDLNIDNNILTIRIDLSKENGFTGSRRGFCVASTGGNLQLWRDGKPLPHFINVNCFKRRPKEEWQKDRLAREPFLDE